MKKYICDTKKDEIIKILVEEFEKVNAEYDKVLKDNNATKQDEYFNFGKYIALIDILSKVKIYEN